jgi:hypothetical protein
MPPDESNTAEHRRAHIPHDDANGLAWLPWRSRGCEYGLMRHTIAKNGYVYETGDRPTEPRRKSKAVSSRRFAGRC